MSETSENTQPAMAYPTKAQYNRWKRNAEEADLSVSEFMQTRIEAGIKACNGFDASKISDQSHDEVRQQRNDLKRELDHARERIHDLENRLHRSERSHVHRYIDNNPGATHAEVIQHIADTVPVRVTRLLESLEGDTVRIENDRYYPANTEDSEVIS